MFDSAQIWTLAQILLQRSAAQSL